MPIIQRGNTKLGPFIGVFSIPAGETCPGETDVCASVCYACSGYYCFPENRRIYQRWLQATKRNNFCSKIVREIANRGYELFRIHSAGDYYDAAYIRKWVKIAKALPQTTFVAYTRTWRCPDKMAALRELAAVQNVILWWSADSETHAINGRPPRVRGVRVAYLAIEYDERIPSYADLVFRHRRKTVEKFRNGRLVCPAENTGRPLGDADFVKEIGRELSRALLPKKPGPKGRKKKAKKPKTRKT